MKLFGKINNRQDELYVKALCFDLDVKYNVNYDKDKQKWFVLNDLSENQYLFILRSAEDYFLSFEKESLLNKNELKISA